ncbi:MAG TPA: hypothetical protein VGC63_13495 [Solirubrobacterales bacterium]
MSLRAAIQAELATLDGVAAFDVHAHTGADVDGTTRSSEEHLRDIEAVAGRSVIFPLCVDTEYGPENRRVLDECAKSAAISDLCWLAEEIPAHPNLFFDTSWWNPSDLIALYSTVPPGRVLYGSDAPCMDPEMVLAINLRCARYAGLSPEAIGLVAGGQLENLLAGEDAVDAGPPPGPPRVAPSPAASRAATAITAAGSVKFAGGDPTRYSSWHDSRWATTAPRSVSLARWCPASSTKGPRPRRRPRGRWRWRWRCSSHPASRAPSSTADAAKRRTIGAEPMPACTELLERNDELATIERLLGTAASPEWRRRE